MKRIVSIAASVAVAGLVALALPPGLGAASAAERVTKKASEGAKPRGAAKPPDASKIKQVPMPTVKTRVAPEACTTDQTRAIEQARAAAAIRSQTATNNARGIHPTVGHLNRQDAEAAANKLIDPDVDFNQVVELTENIRDRVSNHDLPVVCETKENPNCAVRVAFVQDLAAPIHICPAFFETSTEEQRVRTMIHESAHLVGIQEEGDSESYCVLFDCETGCGGFYAADSWAHFVHCVAGQEPDKYDE